jgi:hypothetical protein
LRNSQPLTEAQKYRYKATCNPIVRHIESSEHVHKLSKVLINRKISKADHVAFKRTLVNAAACALLYQQKRKIVVKSRVLKNYVNNCVELNDEQNRVLNQMFERLVLVHSQSDFSFSFTKSEFLTLAVLILKHPEIPCSSNSNKTLTWESFGKYFDDHFRSHRKSGNHSVSKHVPPKAKEFYGIMRGGSRSYTEHRVTVLEDVMRDIKKKPISISRQYSPKKSLRNYHEEQDTSLRKGFRQ